MSRLLCSANNTLSAPEPDKLLDVEEAAKRLAVSEDYLYRHWRELPFARKYDWGLRFSARGIADYIQQTHTRLRKQL